MYDLHSLCNSVDTVLESGREREGEKEGETDRHRGGGNKSIYCRFTTDLQ